eukprot:8391428-Pyramimonas_sp.AAC.1
MKKLGAFVGSSLSRYVASAWTVHAFCELLHMPFLPTTPSTVCTFAAVITHEGTLKTMLSAWR